MKNLLVILLSDQTVPNVQFIKEKKNNETDFLFISTPKMEKKGVKSWIQKVCNISDENLTTIVVDGFSPGSIEQQLNENKLNYSKYDKILVNVTGGTKIMSYATTDFFKKFATEIFYLTGSDNKILQIYPIQYDFEQILSNQISLAEYIESHGFSMKESNLSGIDPTYTQKYLKLFLNYGSEENQILAQLRTYRKKGIKIDQVEGLSNFLNEIQFPMVNDKLTKYEVRYLTGDWFEEYIYYHLKKELSVKDKDIKTGITLKKDNIENEFDVVFIYSGHLFTIECKTSILNDMDNILTETIYKVSALQKNLGLFSNFSIFTLSSKIENEVKDEHLNRARNLFNINVVCKEDIENCQSIAYLLGLNPK